MVTTGFRPPADTRRVARPGRLDESQARVVGLPDGVSAAVIGAPGTGKTTTLIETVVDRVEGRGQGPRSVLVLTPARSTATRLRDVIAARLEVPTPGPVARTVSSLAFDVVGHSALLAGAE
jgi:superfamily I DNA/RNA helicase